MTNPPAAPPSSLLYTGFRYTHNQLLGCSLKLSRNAQLFMEVILGLAQDMDMYSLFAVFGEFTLTLTL